MGGTKLYFFAELLFKVVIYRISIRYVNKPPGVGASAGLCKIEMNLARLKEYFTVVAPVLRLLSW